MRTIITSIFIFVSTVSTSSMQPMATPIHTQNSPEASINKEHNSEKLDSITLQFYASREFKPIWNYQMAVDFFEVLKTCEDEGLSSENFQIDKIANLLHQENQSSVSPKLEKLLTRNFLEYIKNLSQGSEDPEKIYSLWAFNGQFVNHGQVLCELGRTFDVFKVIESYQPKLYNYEALKSFASGYDKIAQEGGWPVIPEGEVMELGSREERISLLRKRLWLTSDLNALDAHNMLFDCELEDAVRNFQNRHGLEVNGRVDEETQVVMNVPVQERVAMIKANLERLRWFGNENPEKYFMVNIPAFQMKIIEENDVSLRMKVAVGKTWRQTPVFSAEMNHVVFNPYWMVPPSILNYDVLPAVKKNANYLVESNMNVLSLDGHLVNPDSVDWDAAAKGHFPYMIRQNPGPGNALGKVKFMFPNKFNIYMHDTNHPEIFNQRDLARSSGCIRLSKPMLLAKHLLGDRLPKRITAKNRTYLLEEKIPVYVTYQTAFVDEKGTLNFRKDIYNKDQKLIEAMSQNCGTSSTLFL